MQNEKEAAHFYGDKWKHLFLLDLHYVFMSLFALFIAVFFHELGHYLAALYYELNPFFGINFSSIYITTNFLDLKTHEIVSHAGPILNLIVASFALIFFYIRGHKYDIGDYVCSILFLIPITNILVAVFSLILFPFSGIL